MERLSIRFRTAFFTAGAQPCSRMFCSARVLLAHSERPYGYAQQWYLTFDRLGEGTVSSLRTLARAVSYSDWWTADRPASRRVSLSGQRAAGASAQPVLWLDPTGPLAASTVARGQLLRPFPQYNGVTMQAATNRNSIYHSMQ